MNDGHPLPGEVTHAISTSNIYKRTLIVDNWACGGSAGGVHRTRQTALDGSQELSGDCGNGRERSPGGLKGGKQPSRELIVVNRGADFSNLRVGFHRNLRQRHEMFIGATPGHFKPYKKQQMVAIKATALRHKVSKIHETQRNHFNSKKRGEEGGQPTLPKSHRNDVNHNETPDVGSPHAIR